ncbi:DUF4446 family protein [Clostridium sp. BSD9I1]|uniref:DUF4446 family protein n=1 Tax=Clostridium sp. BSD9I1 TaxID=2003589 RepID=UPI001646BE67|nr:DUF4446 family protein [Clostridium sp. BSD9I1]
MESLIAALNEVQPFIIIALVAIVIILIIAIAVQGKAISRLEVRYKRLMRGVDNKNLEKVITSYLDKIDESVEKTEHINDLYNELSIKINSCIQKFSIVRYRAFEDVGSDLSYSIALLDNSNNGIILTGLYGRNESTTYAKPIDKGISRYELSDEEDQVLQDAMNDNE